MTARDLRPLQKAQLDIGRTPEDLIAAEVEYVRDDLRSTMGVADNLGLPDIHARLARIVLQIDDLQAVLSERGTR